MDPDEGDIWEIWKREEALKGLVLAISSAELIMPSPS